MAKSRSKNAYSRVRRTQPFKNYSVQRRASKSTNTNVLPKTGIVLARLPNVVTRPVTFTKIANKYAYSNPNTKRVLRSKNIAVHAPKRVLVCLRRKIRKEVIHAIGKSGKGTQQRRPRFTERSNIQCS